MAFTKICPKCKEPSYSAGTDTNWICPTCGEDLNEIPIEENIPLNGRRKPPLKLVQPIPKKD